LEFREFWEGNAVFFQGARAAGGALNKNKFKRKNKKRAARFGSFGNFGTVSGCFAGRVLGIIPETHP
jgi:hypothetical protein